MALVVHTAVCTAPSRVAHTYLSGYLLYSQRYNHVSIRQSSRHYFQESCVHENSCPFPKLLNMPQ